MATAYAPSSQATQAAHSALALRRVYLTRTEDGRLTFSTAGPADAELVENADDRWEPTAVLAGQRLFRTASGRLLILG